MRVEELKGGVPLSIVPIPSMACASLDEIGFFELKA